MNKSDTITNISAALLKAQGEMGNASKGASNPFFKSKFADLNAVREATIPVLNLHGISVLQPTTVHEGKPYVETILLHSSGEHLTSLTEIIAPKANDPQAHGSGVSYARRYGLQSFLCIGAEDDDGEKAMGRSTGKNNNVSNSASTKTETVVGKVEKPQDASVGEPAPKKTGFGVKATVATVTKTEATTDEGWS